MITIYICIYILFYFIYKRESNCMVQLLCATCLVCKSSFRFKGRNLITRNSKVLFLLLISILIIKVFKIK